MNSSDEQLDTLERDDLWDRLVLFLWNLSPPEEPAVIAKGFTLRRPTRNEVGELLNQRTQTGFPSMPRAVDTYPYSEWGETVFECDRYVVPTLSEVFDLSGELWTVLSPFEEALTLGLRLLGDKWVAPHEMVLYRDGLFCGFAWSNVVTFTAVTPANMQGPPYALSGEVIDELKRLWNRLIVAVRDEQLRVAMTRFNYSYDRQRPEDKLIDIWIGLESFYAPPGEKEDLGRSIANGVSLYLGESPQERDELYKAVTDSYAIRSFLIHGHRRAGNFKNEKQVQKTIDELPETVTTAAGWLRRTLLRACYQIPSL